MTQNKMWWLNDESEKILHRGYLLKGETPEQGIHRICMAAADYYDDKVLGFNAYNEFKNLIERGWMSLSSPIWANMGTERGLPISCFNVHVGDSMDSISLKLREVIMQTKIGGGTSGYFGELRGRGKEIKDNGKTAGSVTFMKLFDTAMDTVSQGGVRRGAFAAYLDIDHDDIEEFLSIKDIGNSIQTLFYGVCVSDNWMQEMIDGDKKKRDLWARVLQSRQEKGLPYIFFTDNVNRNKPQIYKDLDIKINSSNLCTEILLPSTENESFICCLSSMNLELYDEWKDTNAVKIAIYFLDAVLQEFIDKTEGIEAFKPTNAFAKRHRALGLGVLGWHSYLQSKMKSFDSFEAKMYSAEIFKKLQKDSLKASEELGEVMGYAPIFNEVDSKNKINLRRNTTLLAIAPTTSSSAILGQTSPGIEPYSSNYYKAGLAKGNFMRKNKYLQKLLKEKNMDNEDVWRSIMLNHGSVQHLEFLSNEEKNVFKTFKEISPIEIITQAAQRQQWIDQSQSLNLNIPHSISIKEVNKLMIEAWKFGIKTLYYQRSQSVSKEIVLEMVNCSSCEA